MCFFDSMEILYCHTYSCLMIIILSLLRLKYNYNSKHFHNLHFLILNTASSLKPTIAYELIRQEYYNVIPDKHNVINSSCLSDSSSITLELMLHILIIMMNRPITFESVIRFYRNNVLPYSLVKS